MAKCQDTEVYEVKSKASFSFNSTLLVEKEMVFQNKAFFKMHKVNLNMIWVLNVKNTVV